MTKFDFEKNQKKNPEKKSGKIEILKIFEISKFSKSQKFKNSKFSKSQKFSKKSGFFFENQISS